MNEMIDNFLNGNLTDAKRQAKRFGVYRIYDFLRELGWKQNESLMTARFLKNQCTWEECCAA